MRQKFKKFGALEPKVLQQHCSNVRIRYSNCQPSRIRPARNGSLYSKKVRVIRLSNLCDTEAYGPVRNTLSNVFASQQVDRMDHRLVCLTLFLVLLADTARGQGCGLSAFQHVPQTHCRGNVLSRTSEPSAEACAQACCENPACKSFQFSTQRNCYLISKICTAEEKFRTPAGNMYDRIQGESKAPPAPAAGCGLSAFQHVPQTHCPGHENLLSRTSDRSAEACAQACCDNPACKSFQFSTYRDCYLIRKICTAEEKVSTPIGNMYDRIQASKRMVEAKETLQDLRDVLLDLEEAAEIDQETRELEDMEEDAGLEEDTEKEVRELEEIEENNGMAEDGE